MRLLDPRRRDRSRRAPAKTSTASSATVDARASRRRRHRHPHAADRYRRRACGRPKQLRQDAPGDRRRRAQPVRRTRLRARAPRRRVRAPRVPPEGTGRPTSTSSLRAIQEVARRRVGDRPEGGGGARHGTLAARRLRARVPHAPRAARCSARWPRAGTTPRSPRALGLSERAVEKHINSVFSKLGLSEEPDVNRRVKAVLLYLADRPSRPALARPRESRR